MAGENVDVHVDVVVIGSGIAGLAAANSAWEAGLKRVLVAEAEGVVGGSSRLSGGIIMGAPTRYQSAAGISDTADMLFHDYMSLNQWMVEAGLIRKYCDEAGAAVDWLGDLGVEFHEDLIFGGGEIVPRCHCAVNKGQGIIDALHAKAREREIDIALGQRIDRLIVENGRVVGVAVGDDEIRAHAVVIASGGFAKNPERLAELYPAAASQGDWLWYIGADGARGDALDLVEPLNAQLVGHNRGLRLLHPNFITTLEAFLPGWMVLVNRDGQRFGAENAPYGLMDGFMRAQGDVAYAIFDDVVLHPEKGPEVASYKQVIPGRENVGSPNWNPYMVEEMVAKGRIKTSDTLEGLAKELGLPVDKFVGQIKRYNAGCRSGNDDFNKDPKFLRAVEHAPYYGAEVRPATLCFTQCGMRIDTDARVLTETGEAIPGLFAAGEATGGVIGDRYVGSGNSLSNGATFGRIAGQAAARTVHS
jgi:fumarate reductase flavoprotein subunit